MTTTIWRGDAAPVAQVSHVTPASIDVGDTFTLTINRKDVTVTATDTTIPTLVALLVVAVNASVIPEFMEVTATAGTTAGVTTHLVLTGPTNGKPFTVTSAGADAGDLAVTVTTSQAGTAGSNEIQLVALAGTAASGHFHLTFDGETTGELTHDESAADIETALEGLTTVPDIDDVTVTGAAGGPWLVEFKGNLANTDVALMTGDGTSIVKGASAYPVLVTTATHGDPGQNEIQQVTLPGPPTGGTFTLAYDGDATGTIAYNASAADVKTAMVAGITVLSADELTITADSTDTGGPWLIEFTGDFANTNVSLLVGDGTSLTGAADATVVVTTEGSPVTNDSYRVPKGNDGSTHTITATNYLGQSDTTQITFPCSADTLETTIEAMSSVGVGSVRVTYDDTNYDVEFIGDLAGTAMTTFLVAGITVTQLVIGGVAGVNEVQTVRLTGGPTGGNFTLTFRGQTTATIWYNAAATTVAYELALLSTTPGFGVTSTTSGEWVVTVGSAEDMPLLVADGTNLTGGTLSIGTTQSAVATTDEVQVVTVYGTPASGTFTLTYDAEETDALDFDATAAEVETALEANTNIAAVGVTGDDGGPWIVTFQGTLGGLDLTPMTGADVDLAGTDVKIEVTQAAVATADEIQLVTLDGDPTGGTFTLTFDSQTTAAVVYNASAAVVQSAMEALSSIDVGEILLTGDAGGPWTVLFRGGLGAQNVGAITGVATSLTKTGTQTFVTSSSVSPTGPNWFDDADNWTEGAVPVDGDTIVFEQSSSDCLYGISQTAITPAAIDRRASYTGKVGLPLHTGLYHEYRDTYLALGNAADSQKITVSIGNGNGSGSGRFKLDTGTAETEIVMLGSGTAEGDMPAVLWKGTHASNIVRVYKGSFGAAVYADEVATIAELDEGYQTSKESDSEVVLGTGVTLTDVEKTGGTLVIGGVSGSAITTFEQNAGETIINGSDGVSALEVDGGTVYYNSTGTLGGAPKVTGDGVLDFSRDMRTKTVTSPVELYGDEANLIDPFQVVTGLVVDYNETTRLANLGQNIRLTRATPS